MIALSMPSAEIALSPNATVNYAGRRLDVPIKQELLGPLFLSREDPRSRIRTLTAIEESQHVRRSSKERIFLATRALSIGLAASTAQEQFLSLWVGLEALLHPGQTNILEVRRFVAQLLGLEAPRRLLRDLLENIKRLDVGASLSIPLGRPGVADEDGLWQVLLDPLELDRVCREVEPTAKLLVLRLREIAEALGTPESARSSIKRKHDHVSQHVQRMYRVRNSLVHDGQAPEDLTQMASHLVNYVRTSIVFISNHLSRTTSARSIEDVGQKLGWVYDYHLKRLKDNHMDKTALLHPFSIWPTTR